MTMLPALDHSGLLLDGPLASPDLRRLVERLQSTAPDLDRAGAVPTREVAMLAEAGLLSLPVPRRHGGLGLGTEAGETATLLALLSEIGRGNLSLGRIY